MNGIDVSDPTRNFNAQEWETLGPANHALIMEMRNHASGQGRGTGGQGCRQGQGCGDDNGGQSVNVNSVTFENDGKQNDGQSKDTRNERGGRNRRGFGHGAYGLQNRS